MPFKVSKFPEVKAQIQAMLKRAKSQGILPSYLHALKRIQEHLETRPLEWGDPDYNLKLPGAVAFHGIEEPLIVRFGLYEAEGVVCIFGIEPLPGSKLAGP